MTPPPVSSATVNLTTSGNFGTIGGAVFTASQTDPAWIGNFGTFVQIGDHGTEHGYNTNARPRQFDAGNSLLHNRALLLASIPIVEGDGSNGTVEGVLYREFLLDANESNGHNREFLSLDALQIYQANVGNLSGFHQPAQQGGNGTGFGANATLIYDMDADSNSWVALNADISHGSASTDARVLIPDALFDQNTPYVVLYSAFGYQGTSWRADGGNEEWRTRGPHLLVPALNVAMTASVPGGTADQPGEVITYAITLRNMGNLPLTGVTVTDSSVSDPTRGADIVGNNDNILSVGEIWSYTAHHTVTQADINGGGVIVNTVTADSHLTGPDSATVSTTVERASQIEVVIEPDVTSVDAAGDVINHTVSIENTGSTSLTNPVVGDQELVPVLNIDAPIGNPNIHVFFSVNNGDFNLGDTNENNVQDPGETFQYVYPGDITQDGVHDPGETWVAFNLGDTDVDGVHDAGETWVGDTNQNGIEEPGERWQFQNLGDTNHNNRQDPGETWQYANAGDNNQNGVVDPGETFFFRNAGDTDQDGIQDAGEAFQFYNAGDTNQNGVEDPGETFQFAMVLHPLDGVDADSNGFNDGDADNNGILDPGETWLYVGPTHVVTQADIDNGGVIDPGLSIDSTVTASTDQTDIVSATASVAVVQTPDVTLLNDAVGGTYDDLNLNGRPDAGETISYTFTVTNSGNMTLFDINVADDDVTISGTTIASLAPGASDGATFTGSYVIQQADIDAGVFNNTSTTSAAAGASGGFPVSDDDDENVVLPQIVSLSLDKTGVWADGSDGDGFADPGELVSYTFTIVNDGNVTLDGVELDDTLLGALSSPTESGGSGTNGDGILDVGETWTFEADYAIDQDDIDAGSVENEATVTAEGPQNQPASDTDDHEALLPQNAHLTVNDAASIPDDDLDTKIDSPADDISHIITVTNDGNITLTGVQVADSILGTLAGPADGDADNDGFLDVGESWIFEALYGVEQIDIDNRGNVDGTADDNIHNDVAVTTDQGVTGGSSADVGIDYRPEMQLMKLGTLVDSNDNGIAEEGEVIDYIFTINNIGNVTLTSIEVEDLNAGVLVSGSPIASLAPGESDAISWSAMHTITADDIQDGIFTNEARAVAAEVTSPIAKFDFLFN